MMNDESIEIDETCSLSEGLKRHALILQVRKSLYTTSVGKWKRYTRQMEGVRQRLLPVIDQYKSFYRANDHTSSGEL